MKDPNNILSKKRPDLCKEWDYEKNYPLTPDDVTYASHEKVWWKCKNGHRWKAVIGNRAILNEGCSVCPRRPRHNNCLAVRYPKIAKEWHPTKNGKLTPYDVTYSSHEKVWWKCKKEHIWEGSINSRTNHMSGCPYCGGKRVNSENCLATLNPKLASEWHPTKNGDLTPYDVTSNSGTVAWWVCQKEKNHQWTAIIASRNRGAGCPYCSGHKMSQKNCLAVVNPYLLAEWDYERNHNLSPYNMSYGSRTMVWWKCRKEHSWRAAIKTRSNGSECPKCRGYVLKNGVHFNSLLEIWFYLKFKRLKKQFQYNQAYPRLGNKKLGKRGLMRFDFYFPKSNKYLEVTSYSPKYCIDIKQYRSYLKKIKIKQNYVEKILNAKFQFIQKRLTKKEIEYIKRYAV